MNTLRFNEIDLEANRKGRLTDAQRKKLDAEVKHLKRSFVSVILTFLGGLAMIIIITLVETRGGKYIETSAVSSLTPISLFLIGALLLLIGFGILLSVVWRISHSYTRGKIRSDEGKAQILNYSISRRGTPEWFYLVRLWRGWWWVTFRFQDAESLKYFQAGQLCRIYYLLYYSQLTLLSVEPLLDKKVKR